ncbi:MAG: hypothetical protein CMQ34_07655 [Gammaproteobacteria bacterium]|nr:hypothetical protein [Gammaproteobacteria bacterium]|tara:strand:- start:1106 stop:1453 length:348 start_codon:yes stop_codon:yes gene_type:complete
MDNPEKNDNTESNQALAWSRIVAASDQLAQLAEQKNWDKLGRLQVERDRLIEHFFSSETRPELITGIQADIRKICEQDRRIIQMVTDNRAQLGAEALHLRAMKNRIEQYLSTEDH